MKLLFFTFCFPVAFSLHAQVPAAMPPEADAFYNEAMPVINAHLKTAVLKTAVAMKERKPNADSLYSALKKQSPFKELSEQNLRGVTTLIMVQAAKNTDDDLKKMVLSMNSKSSSAPSEKQEEFEQKQLRLKMIMLRKSKLAEEVSVVMKNISDNTSNIISDLR